jgi:ABC-type multidrug transport system fused ATPase/permease subunit
MLEYTGTIRIDGTDISTIPHETVRSQVTTLSQDPVLLPGSVRENLDPVAFLQQDTVEATAEKDAELVTALTRVGLWDTIRGRGGLGADVSTLGLSHGERQLLSLARALLHCQSTSGRLVLVDEATSGMDQDTDRRMQDVMLDIFAGCTVLVIAHRLETIKNADLVVEMAGGGIVGVRNREI